jgi:hypothetical protein
MGLCPLHDTLEPVNEVVDVVLVFLLDKIPLLVGLVGYYGVEDPMLFAIVVKIVEYFPQAGMQVFGEKIHLGLQTYFLVYLLDRRDHPIYAPALDRNISE